MEAAEITEQRKSKKLESSLNESSQLANGLTATVNAYIKDVRVKNGCID